MSSPQKVLNCRYRYDPLDRLTSHTLSDTPERHRFYCKSRLATEVQGAVGHSIVQQGDLLLAQHQRQNGVLDSTLLATDLQRSVLNTLKSGRQPQPIAYSPYGHRPAESGLSSLLGFNGERPDPVTGHYLLGNGYRAFNPVLMRFNSPDSLSPFGKGGLNSYSYCLGDPVNLSDFNGHLPLPKPFSIAFTKTLQMFGRTRKTYMSGTERTIETSVTKTISTHTVEFSTPATGMGVFEQLKGIPHVMEKITQQLQGSDMVSLAQTSSEMKAAVFSAAKPLPNELHGITKIIQHDYPPDSSYAGGFWNSYRIEGNRDLKKVLYIYEGNVQRIASGIVPGIMPIQLPRAGIKIGFSSQSIEHALTPDPYRTVVIFSGDKRNWTIRNRT